MRQPVDALMRDAARQHAAGRLAEAERLCRTVLQQAPRHAGALLMTGTIALAGGRAQRAADLIARAVALDPGDARAHAALALALAALGRPDEALARFDAALALQPGFADALFNKGALLQRLGRNEEAIGTLGAAVALRPRDADALNTMGLAHAALGRDDDALGCFDRAIRAQPDLAPAHANRGIALHRVKRLPDALASHDRALALRPDSAEAWCNRGDTLHELGRPQDAIASFDRAIALRPDLAEAHFGRSLSLLSLGRYEEGFRAHEWRKRRPGADPARFPKITPWLGGPGLEGRVLFVYPELYLGDMVQFCRYAPLAAARGAKVVLAVQRKLLPLLSSLGGGVTVIEDDGSPPRFDLHCPLLSLPLAMGTTYGTVPAAVPYLRAGPDLVAAWRARLGGDGIKIGVCWQGDPSRSVLERSFPLALLGPLAAEPGVRLINLQSGAGLEQAAGMRIEHADDLPPDGLRPFADLAAMIEAVDLVVTCDTVVAHVAGALGRPTWVALRHVPDWRWGQGDTTPWYPTLLLFRQPSPGDWAGVFAAMLAALRAGGAVALPA